MATKVKARCTSVTDNGYTKTVKFYAVSGKQNEGSNYAKNTPFTTIEMVIDRDSKAAEIFTPQKFYNINVEETTN